MYANAKLQKDYYPTVSIVNWKEYLSHLYNCMYYTYVNYTGAPQL